MSLSEKPLVTAAKMAVHEINASGGVLGKKVEAIIANGASDPLEFSRKAGQLRDDGITTIFGCWTSASRKSVREVIEESNTQLWYPIQYEGLEESPNIYYTGSTLNQQIEPAIHWCLERLGKKVLLLGSDYVFPRTSNRLIRSIITEAGGEILEEIYHPLGDKNFTHTIACIEAHQPDVIFNTLNGNSNISFYKELHKYKMFANKFPVMAVSLGEVESASIPEEICGHYTCWGYFQTVDTAINRDFVQAFQNFSDSIGVTSDPIVTAYSQVHLWAKAVNAAESTQREKVHEALMKLNFSSPLGKFQIQKNHHIARKALIGKAGAHGQYEIIKDSQEVIAPLPWLGVETLTSASVHLIKDIMSELPCSINAKSQLLGEIKERKKAEQIILSERNTSESYLKIANVMLLAIDAKKRVSLANVKACEVLGYAEDEILGKNWFDCFLPVEDKHDVISVFEQIIAGDIEAVKYFENNVVTKHGVERIIAWNNTVIRGDDGKITHILSSGTDVTEARRAALLANRISQTYEMLASGKQGNEIYDAICSMYEEANPGMRASILRLVGNKLFHCSDQSLPREYSKAVNGVEIGACVGSCGTAAFMGKSVIVGDIETDPLWAPFKGLALPHNLRACWSEPIIGTDGKVLGTFAMYFDHPNMPSEKDIEEIKNASGLVAVSMEKESREALLNKLSLVIHQAGESIVITDEHANIEFVNPAFEEITGYSANEAIGQNPRILNSGQHDMTFYKVMWDTITKGDTWQGRIICKKKDESFYPAMLMISPLRNKSGEITHYVSLQQDISEYENLEEQFNQAQKMEAMGTLVGGIAHDFNNTLAGITGNIYLLKKTTNQIPDASKRLDTINSLSMRAADMIHQLLTFARKDLKSMNPLRISAFLKESLKLNQLSMPESIEVVQDIPDSEVHILADLSLLQQVLLNLLNNARDAVAEKKHARISVELSEIHSPHSFFEHHPEFQSKNMICIAIKDNGYGIKDDDFPHIFDPFFTTKDVGKGTGLGLAMSYGAIKSHEGIIDVESNVDRGTTFKIYLPSMGDNAIIMSSKVDDDVLDGNGEFILLVDDEVSLLESGRAVLNSLGYKVMVAHDGVEAVDIYTSHQSSIDLVITDVVMPHMSGIDAAKAFRKINPTAKVLFVTGYDRTNSFRKDDRLDSDYVLQKPFSVAQLSQKIRGILEPAFKS